MKIKLLILLVAFSSVYGCGKLQFVPQEYPLRDGLIPQVDIKGTVTVNNVQPSTKEAIVYSYGGSELATNYHAITQLMVDQTTKEIKKNGKFSSTSTQKSIDLNVHYLLSTYIAFYWKSELKYTAKLGNGVTLDKTVKHGSGNLHQDLNGCVAESVLDLLNDPQVRAYLAE